MTYYWLMAVFKEALSLIWRSTKLWGALKFGTRSWLDETLLTLCYIPWPLVHRPSESCAGDSRNSGNKPEVSKPRVHCSWCYNNTVYKSAQNSACLRNIFPSIASLILIPELPPKVRTNFLSLGLLQFDVRDTYLRLKIFESLLCTLV